MDIGVKEIRKWHTKGRGWKDIGYHMVVRRNGTIEHGRPITQTPAAQRGYNVRSIAICLVGGVDANGRPENNFTPPQFAALKREIECCRVDYDVVSIIGHNDVSSKSCPCFDVHDWVYRNLVRG